MATELRTKGRAYGIYASSRSMRVNLYSYYRLHAWKALEFGADYLGLYALINTTFGAAGASNWKMPNSEGLVYRSDEQAIGSIRLEAFRQGLTDMAYLDLLDELSKRLNSATAIEAQEFLRNAPRKAIYELRQEQGTADILREQAIAYILALQEGK